MICQPQPGEKHHQRVCRELCHRESPLSDIHPLPATDTPLPTPKAHPGWALACRPTANARSSILKSRAALLPHRFFVPYIPPIVSGQTTKYSGRVGWYTLSASFAFMTCLVSIYKSLEKYSRLKAQWHWNALIPWISCNGFFESVFLIFSRENAMAEKILTQKSCFCSVAKAKGQEALDLKRIIVPAY